VVRKWSHTTPKGYLPESQLHLSNEYVENVIDNSLVITTMYPPARHATGGTLIVNDNNRRINFNKNWQRKEQDTNREGFPFGGTTHETMHIGSRFTYSFTGVWFFFDLR